MKQSEYRGGFSFDCLWNNQNIEMDLVLMVRGREYLGWFRFDCLTEGNIWDDLILTVRERKGLYRDMLFWLLWGSTVKSKCTYIYSFSSPFHLPPWREAGDVRKFSDFWLTVRLFCMALVERLGDNSWYVQLAAIWHWFLPLCFYIIYCYFCFFFIVAFNLVLIN